MQGGKKKTFLLRIVILACLVGVVFVSMSVYREIRKKRQIQNEIAKLQEEAQKISRDNSNLEEKIAYLESAEYKEKEAKDKLNLQNPGENVVIIKNNPAKETVSEESPRESVRAEVYIETNNPKKWWNYFFGYKQ